MLVLQGGGVGYLSNLLLHFAYVTEAFLERSHALIKSAEDALLDHRLPELTLCAVLGGNAAAGADVPAHSSAHFRIVSVTLYEEPLRLVKLDERGLHGLNGFQLGARLLQIAKLARKAAVCLCEFAQVVV